MTLLSFAEFFGRLHPLLVHLPIGVLMLGIVLHWLSKKQQFKTIGPAVSITLLLGAVTAVFACISGWLLAGNGDYDAGILDRHRWMGIAVALIALVYYAIYSEKIALRVPPSLVIVLSVVLFLLISITGHLGGTLTHGEGYLTQGIYDGDQAKEIKKVIPNVQEAKIYDDIIQPVLQSKCYSCHGPSKQKGKLRLDSKDAILKGGEDGLVLVAGKGNESELYKRLTLDLLEKHHMPPKGKSQPSEAEISLIHWWINSGAGFDQQVKSLPQDAKIKPLLLALQQDNNNTPSGPDIPESPVEPASAQALNNLRELGAAVVPVSAESNYLSVNFLDSKQIGADALKLLEPIEKQLVWLKLGNTAVDDSAMTTIGRLPELIRLNLENTSISDSGLVSIQRLQKLKYLNLTGTKVTASGVQQLKHLPVLSAIYLYHTGVTSSDWLSLKQAFPKTQIDTGGYHLPVLESDTVMITQKR